MILTCLVEGNSINATIRMTGASKVTILRLLADCPASKKKDPAGLPPGCSRLRT